MVQTLAATPGIHGADLNIIARWADERDVHEHFNLACLFTIDAGGAVRLCIHPKMVRSKFEISPLPENNMAEANVISLVSLLPADSNYSTVTLQPLICSDMLELQTDVPWQRPLEIVSQHPDKLDGRIPDHIDIVSVVTCTPQYETFGADDGAVRQWYPDFRHTFVRLGLGGLARHTKSAFVLSNYRNLALILLSQKAAVRRDMRLG